MPVWTYHEIMQYFPHANSKTTAIKIKQRAIKEYQGSVSYGTEYVKTDSVLALIGTSREKELSILKRNNDDEKDFK